LSSNDDRDMPDVAPKNRRCRFSSTAKLVSINLA